MEAEADILEPVHLEAGAALAVVGQVVLATVLDGDPCQMVRGAFVAVLGPLHAACEPFVVAHGPLDAANEPVVAAR